MNQLYYSINIDGEYIDSFIYRNFLYLVDATSKVSIYDWRSLYVSLGSELFKISQPEFRSQPITVDKLILNNTFVSSLQLEGWPNDINIFNNIFYVANEKGVRDYFIDNYSGKFSLREGNKIWDKYTYHISPNSGNRLAIASGSNGVIIASPTHKNVSVEENIIRTLEIYSIDCEWLERYLVSNSNKEIVLLTFTELPKRPEGKPSASYWDEFKRAKEQPPTQEYIGRSSDSHIIYSWLAEDKLLSLAKNGDVLERPINSNDSLVGVENESMKINENMGNILAKNNPIITARSSGFGTAIEIGEELFVKSRNNIEQICQRPVCWRVFPRSKDYLNQLHVVEKNQLSIKIFGDTTLNDESQKNDRASQEFI